MSDPKTIREEEPILSLSVYLDRVDYTVNNQNMAALERLGADDTLLKAQIECLKGIFETAHADAVKRLGSILEELFPEVSRSDAIHISYSSVFALSGEEVEEDED